MKSQLLQRFSPFLLPVLVLLYGLSYAPYGINETDGGFITAYAWRMLNGEWPYRDFIYVRPPMSLCIRYLEMSWTPDHWEVLSERWLFYLKIALANYWAAAVLSKGSYKWWLAALGFLFSAHNYPAAAWHTVDGVCLGALAIYACFRSERWLLPMAIATLFSALCKQSFYPLLPMVFVIIWLTKPRIAAVKGSVYLILSLLLTYAVFYGTGTWDNFVAMSTGATSFQQLWDFALVSMLRIDLRLGLLSLLLIPYLLGFRYPYLFFLLITSLIVFYALQVYTHDYWIPPMRISRWLWLLSFLYTLREMLFTFRKSGFVEFRVQFQEEWIKVLALLGLSWMTVISWGYNFPLFLSTPYFYVFGKWIATTEWNRREKMALILQGSLLVSMLLVFYYGYTNIYRDEPRMSHTCELEQVFPQLAGIKSSEETCALYGELKQLSQKYGPRFKTLPSFLLANYLTQTSSPWPIDWATAAEIKGLEEQIYTAMERKQVYYFVEKSYGSQLLEIDKFATTKYVMQSMRKIEETTHFEVYLKE